MEDKKRLEPIHALERHKAKYLVGKSILYANDKEGLGCYGTLEGFSDKTGKFIVKSDHCSSLLECVWIVRNP